MQSFGDEKALLNTTHTILGFIHASSTLANYFLSDKILTCRHICESMTQVCYFQINTWLACAFIQSWIYFSFTVCPRMHMDLRSFNGNAGSVCAEMYANTNSRLNCAELVKLNGWWVFLKAHSDEISANLALFDVVHKVYISNPTVCMWSLAETSLRQRILTCT